MRPPPTFSRSPAIDHPDLAAAKASARRAARARRAALARAALPGAGERLADRLTAALDLSGRRIVAGYWPAGTEIDPRPFLRRVAAAGHACCLPVAGPSGAPLTFRRWRPETALTEGVFRILVPAPEEEALTPEIVAVPLLAADREGHRLGYGGGYYDRTLAALRARGRVRAIGLAYAGQILAGVPRGPADAALDAVATERAVIRIGEST